MHVAGSVSQASQAQEKTMELMGSLTFYENAKEMWVAQSREPTVSTHTVSKINQQSDDSLHSH